MKRLILISILLIIVLPQLLQATDRCTICKKELTGRYIKFEDGSKYCLDCVKKYPACDICGKPSPSYIIENGKRICLECLAKMGKCSFCGKPLTGKYYSYPELGLKLCENCNKTVKRCFLCGRPGKNLILVDDKYICNACYDRLDKCHICGKPIIGEYMWFDNEGSKKYCPSCVKKYPHCANCGAPVGPYGVRLDDGRILCPDCYRTACFKPEQVSAIKGKVIDYLKSVMGIDVHHKIRFLLEGRDFIKQKSKGISNDVNGLFYRQNDNFEIYVLYGLREKELYQVLPHEIAHAWMAENCDSDIPAKEAEGFAQWVAYHALGHFGFGDYRRTLLEGESVYATGLRKMMEIEKDGGVKAVFDYFKGR